MKKTHKIRLSEHMIDELTKDFVHHMFSEENEEDINDFYWIADNKTWTLEVNDTYWSLGDIVEVLKNNYPRKKVFAWYDYSTYYSSKDNNLFREYYINMSNFMKMYDGEMEVSEFSQIYREKRDKDQFYWNSPEGKKKEEEMIKPLVDKYKKDIEKYKHN